MTRGLANTFTRNFLQTSFFFYFYDFWRDTFWAAQNGGDWSNEMVKTSGLFFGATVGCAASYPYGVLAKRMADVSPNLKDGSHPHSRNYRIAIRDLWYSSNFSGLWIGFSRFYYWRTMPWMFVSGWIADDLGLFTHWKNNHWDYAGNNSTEDIFC